jgi:phospholipid/cholesterol/gamma-HCH transport system substrate-binding protein
MIRTALKFGGFVAVCLVFTMYLAFTIGNLKVGELVGDHRYTLTATFDDVTGLLPNDNVKVAGVVVGKVNGISTVDGKAKITFDVKNDVTLPSDTSAAIRWRNLIGQRYVYLYPGKAPTTLTDGSVIKDTKSVIDLGELFNRLGPIVSAIDPQQVNAFLDTVTQALEGREDKVGKALDDLAVLAKGLGERDQTIGRLVENLDTVAGTISKRDEQIKVMLDNLVAISQTFSDNTDTLDAAITELGGFGRDLSFLLENNRAELDRLLTNLSLVVDTVHTKLPQLDSALANLGAASRSVFLSGRFGEFLNEEILCAATGPPTAPLPGTDCDTAIVKHAPGDAGPASTVKGKVDGGSVVAALIRGGR